MNYCVKCCSLYLQPGTCNCFAGTQPRIVPAPLYPLYPQPWSPITPTINPFPNLNPWTITVTANAADAVVYAAPLPTGAAPMTSGYSVPVCLQ